MAKVKLGVTPTTYTKTISFEMIDPETGKPDTGKIDVTFKYRTRDEFGQFIDELGKEQRALDEQAAPTEGEPFSMGAYMASTNAAKVRYVMQVAEGWGLGEPFTEDSVTQLGNQIPDALRAIMESYRAACTEGRLGN